MTFAQKMLLGGIVLLFALAVVEFAAFQKCDAVELDAAIRESSHAAVDMGETIPLEDLQRGLKSPNLEESQ